MGYIEAEAQAWERVTVALDEYLRVLARYTDVHEWMHVVDEVLDSARTVMIDDLLPEVMQDARGMQYTGDNQPKGA